MIAFALAATLFAAEPSTLSLSSALELAITRSPDVESALLSLEGAALSPHVLDDTFAWTAFAEGGIQRDDAPRTSGFAAETVTTVPVSAGASRLFPTGTLVDIQAAGSWFDAPVDFGAPLPIDFVESGWTQGLTISARHPLLGSRPDRQVELRRKEIEAGVAAGGARVAEGLEMVFADVHRRFWMWVLATEAEQAAAEAQKAAEDLRTLVARKLARGTADERDRLRVEAGVKQAADQVLAAERTTDAARRALLDRLGSPGMAPPERPGYSLDSAVTDVALEQAIARAEASSLTLRSLESARAAQLATIAVQEEALGSRLFAIGRVGEQALFPNGTDSQGDPFDDDFGVVAFGGLRWERNFGESAARTRVRQARIELKRLDADVTRAKERIRTAAAEHLAAIAFAKKRLDAARGLVATQESRLAEEERNFGIGRSPLRDVIEARNALTQARFLEASARVSLQMAATERDLLDGTLTAPWRERLAARAPSYRAILKSSAPGAQP